MHLALLIKKCQQLCHLQWGEKFDKIYFMYIKKSNWNGCNRQATNTLKYQYPEKMVYAIKRWCIIPFCLFLILKTFFFFLKISKLCIHIARDGIGN